MRGFTEEELPAFVALRARAPYEVRFIEFMPLDGDHAWRPEQVLTGEEIRAAIDALQPLEPEPRDRTRPHARTQAQTVSRRCASSAQ